MYTPTTQTCLHGSQKHNATTNTGCTRLWTATTVWLEAHCRISVIQASLAFTELVESLLVRGPNSISCCCN